MTENYKPFFFSVIQEETIIFPVSKGFSFNSHVCTCNKNKLTNKIFK